MVARKDTEAFLGKAEQLNARIGANALADADELLDPEEWVASCDTTPEFFYEYRYQLEQSLSFLIANPDAEPPPILRVLATADLEARFPPFDPRAEKYAPLTLEIEYVTSRVVVALLTGTAVPDLASRAKAAFAALWALPGAGEIYTRERWEAHEALLHLAFGRHEEVVRAYDRHGFELAKDEGADRTLFKECYMLSRVATGTADEDLRFGARSHVALLKFSFWLWKVNEDPSAEIGRVPLVLVSWLYERIAKGAAPQLRDLLASMAPRAAVQEMEALKQA